MTPVIHWSDFLSVVPDPLGPLFGDRPPWLVTQDAPAIIRRAAARMSVLVETAPDIWIHSGATVEPGAILKPPVILNDGAFVAAGAYLRGGVFLDADCIVGPSCELKTVLMFRSSKVAHLSFVGDSVIGAHANIEAGAMIANYRNERDDKTIRIRHGDSVIETGVDKFGALVGDGVRIGANAVIAPGALLRRGTIIPRLALVDQHSG